jgi:hypothetical protein
MGSTLGLQAVGAAVQIRESGVLQRYLVLNQGNPSSAYQGYNNATLLIRERALGNRQMHSAYLNNYQGSDINTWLNNDYLNIFDMGIRSQIVQGRIPFRPGSGTSPVINSGANGLLTRAFLLSYTEAGFSQSSITPNTEGIRFPLFPPAVNSQGNSGQVALNDSGSAALWWLRSPHVAGTGVYLAVSAIGALSWNDANSTGAPRPIIALPSTMTVSASGEVIGILPPTMPATLTVPTLIPAGNSFTVSWTAATDPQGLSLTYILERNLNSSGVWAQVGTVSAALSRTDTVASGNATAQYRVRARNTAGLESANNTGAVLNVVSNNPPVISGSDTDLGVLSAPFTWDYTVTDPDPGDVITVTERLNGVLMRQYVANSGDNQTLSVILEQFLTLGAGNHTLTVTASDQLGASVVRTLTFSRDSSQLNQILVELQNPLSADDMPVRLLLSVLREISGGAAFLVEACNNAFDDTPAWEDVTSAVIGESIYVFANTTKTAAEWGVNIRISVQRNTAIGDCWVSFIGGNFDGGMGTTSEGFDTYAAFA